MLIVNPNSGKGTVSSALFDIIDTFSNSDYLVTTYMTKAAGDAGKYADAFASEYDLIVCVGGDGTLSDTISGLVTLDGKPPLGYIPMGTTNDLATTFKLPRNPRAAAQHIISSDLKPFDVGKFEDHYFSYVHAFGAFTEVSFSTSQDMKKTLGHLAYVLEGMSKLSTITSEHCVVEYDGGVLEDNFIFGAVTNSTSVAGLFKLPGDEVHLNDGLFEVLLIKYPRKPADFGNIISNVLSRQYDPEYVSLLHTRKIRFTFDKPVAWTRDGEDGGIYQTATAENLHEAVTLKL